MTSLYTAPGRYFLKNSAGTDSYIISKELVKVDACIDAAKIKIIDLTASMVSATSLAANGADLASGSNQTFYAVFMAPAACTIVSMDVYVTEAYVKETTDAKIELKTDAGSPVTKCTTTFATAGVAAKTILNITPTDAALAAGDVLNLVVTQSASISGTGHAKVFLRYTVN